ncbi:MAG: alpha/beta hydrolase [Thermoanaerobaculaceae bacterium]|nr:alpha/beta hydrolase [Thermoanaerobaculaceae bacterium]MDI9623021.1 alpha/beta hydrolase [Acidobacteriota bacterium]NLH12182.1 alpha/beta hydrolase [Holophagae bacterium]HPW55000.1 alpha/beta hydrolase [Thermoanaerobaculaceae bacterium]
MSLVPEDSRRFRRRARLLGWLALVVAVAVGGLMLLERHLIFFPARYPIGEWDLGAWRRRTGCQLEDRFLTTSDGVRLHAWWVSPPDPAPPGETIRSALLYLHGNAGNLSHRGAVVATLARHLGMDVLIPDYRGYGRSEGRPGEEGLYEDARTVWRFLTEDRGLPARRVVVYGKSLGGGVATRLASDVHPAGLVLQSTFTSIPDLAAHHYPFVPRLFVRTQMDSLSRIASVGCPVLIIHSRADEVVPFAQGERLYAAAREPKRFFAVELAGHNDTFDAGGEALLAALVELARAGLGEKATPARCTR